MEFIKIQDNSESPVSLPDSYSRDQRKTEGIFYTPQFLAQYLAKKTIGYIDPNTTIRSILDPACGDGVLIRTFIRELKEQHDFNLIGIDKDINAVSAATAKWLEMKSANVSGKFYKADGLFPYNTSLYSRSWEFFRRKANENRKFDVILSNPPWGARLDNYGEAVLASSFSLARGQFDIYDLFVEAILDNLSDGGMYGLILPDSVFGREHTGMRRLLAEGTTINLIARLGEKIFEGINRACVVIIGKKEIPSDAHRVDCFRLNYNEKRSVLCNLNSLEDSEKGFLHRVSQKRFLTNQNFIFDIDLKTEEEKIIRKVESSETVFNCYTSSTRGVEISKKGLVCKCRKCGLWIPLPKKDKPQCSHCGASLQPDSWVTEKIVLNHNGPGNLKLKVGEDLGRYISFSRRWIDTSKAGINYKDIELYKGDKILVRKTGIGITASLDYEEAVSNQVVYIVKLKPIFQDLLTLEFVLAVLNSRVMTYYLIKKYGENEWKSHPYITQFMLANLPFPLVDSTSPLQRTLITKATKLLRKEIRSSSLRDISLQCDLVIERIVAHFFKLSAKDYQTIFATLASSQQLIPIKRLLNCDYKDIFKVSYL